MTPKQFTHLAYDSVDDFLYGACPNPVTCKNGMVIGGGIIYPEINFTLPAMEATQETLPKAKEIYKEIISDKETYFIVRKSTTTFCSQSARMDFQGLRGRLGILRICINRT